MNTIINMTKLKDDRVTLAPGDFIVMENDYRIGSPKIGVARYLRMDGDNYIFEIDGSREVVGKVDRTYKSQPFYPDYECKYQSISPFITDDPAIQQALNSFNAIGFQRPWLAAISRNIEGNFSIRLIDINQDRIDDSYEDFAVKAFENSALLENVRFREMIDGRVDVLITPEFPVKAELKKMILRNNSVESNTVNLLDIISAGETWLATGNDMNIYLKAEGALPSIKINDFVLVSKINDVADALSYLPEPKANKASDSIAEKTSEFTSSGCLFSCVFGGVRDAFYENYEHAMLKLEPSEILFFVDRTNGGHDSVRILGQSGYEPTIVSDDLSSYMDDVGEDYGLFVATNVKISASVSYEGEHDSWLEYGLKPASIEDIARLYGDLTVFAMDLYDHAHELGDENEYPDGSKLEQDDAADFVQGIIEKTQFAKNSAALKM